MGADIHLVLEKRNSHGKWVGINDFAYINPASIDVNTEPRNAKVSYLAWHARSRNYNLFAALAGVRGDGPDPLGMPDDASDLTRMRLEEWSSDAHSVTWYSLRDAVKIFERIDGNNATVAAVTGKLTNTYVPPPSIKWFGVDRDEASEDDLRIVCWFDN